MKGKKNKKGNCLYRDDDMILTEEQMLQIFGLSSTRNAQTDPTKKWTNGVIPVKFDTVISAAEKEIAMAVANRFNQQMDGCLSIVYVLNFETLR